ncbi:MAG: hypothetical protein JXB32_04935 [Deltaproteobacteria bacterium]|nr:hypothetical protein [Deltaproteobacteria bacterium]
MPEIANPRIEEYLARLYEDGDPVRRELETLAHERLRPGGLSVTDNALWYGRVLDDADDGSAETAGVRESTRRLLAHPGFLTTIDPTRDGVAVALRR